MRRYRNILLLFGLIGLMVGMAIAQSRRSRFQGGVPDRGNVPQWQLPEGFNRDCFTFTRVQYTSRTGRRSQVWDTDYRDADLNLSYRLHHTTAMKVDPEGQVVSLTDPEMAHCPFLFMSGVGGLMLDDQEVRALRRHLNSGGFLLVDDFWGEAEWANFYREIKRVFPEREPIDLSLDHPIFHTVFDLREKPQIPNVFHAMRFRETGITWERSDAREPHYRAIFDDHGRILVMICHNTDLGDGWEEESTDPYYFAEFSEPKAYPLGINILFFAMTH
ncbi:MAG TPA: DUF4159 domain-containing protein [Candidatus Paceibacterota bacterium]|nr:DUF4159 domain-containing protein [Verrucomicrobiota bacterium]HRY48315.1 DUF4159 domain-containing protein [Candidatus Paceibacterota bacterium]HSA03718.1 DUF4159 domain-containing protein [Candidatus Paceibacterota bacterium]